MLYLTHCTLMAAGMWLAMAGGGQAQRLVQQLQLAAMMATTAVPCITPAYTDLATGVAGWTLLSVKGMLPGSTTSADVPVGAADSTAAGVTVGGTDSEGPAEVVTGGGPVLGLSAASQRQHPRLRRQLLVAAGPGESQVSSDALVQALAAIDVHTGHALTALAECCLAGRYHTKLPSP